MTFNKLIRSMLASAAVIAALAFLLWSIKSEGSQVNCEQLHTLADNQATFANDAAVARAKDGNIATANKYRQVARASALIAQSNCN